jgi:hypothetical protein
MPEQTRAKAPAAAAEPRKGSELRDALRRARVEAVEQTDVVIDLRQAEIARLELLKDALDPVFAQVPPEVDLFDVGLAPGERPRLFVDMVSFVEMGRDRRVFRFMRDSRRGRVCVAESDRPEPIVEAVTAYVARRLVERERLLSGDDAPVGTAEEPSGAPPGPKASGDRAEAPVHAATGQGGANGRKSSRLWLRALTVLLAFAFGGAVGAVVVGGLIYAVAKGLLPV